ncbi:tyrosine-type recombinase/integrase [Reyranella sp.]|uniref:tyrosine-type recombinase/integrase n=1 Tax=Reyranella sp. TaxID=1929291 RepID=UPI003D0C7A56
MKKAITKRAVDALKPGEYITDTDVLGFVVRRLPSGRLSYGFRYAKDGKRRWIKLGVGIPPDAARKAALKHAGSVAGDGNPLPERQARRVEAMTARTVNDVLDGFLVHARSKRLRSVAEMESLLRRHVRPKLGGRRVNAVKRSEIADLLKGIAALPSTRASDGQSRRVADKVLGVLRSAFNWHQIHDDDFVSPIVKGMAQTTLKELSRDRVLDDAEIRTLWQALDQCGPPAYVRLVRALLLSAARLNEVARLQWPEIVGDVAIVPATRTKTKIDFAIPITPDVAALIGEGPGEAGGFVFSTDHGASPFSGFSKAKKRLDAEIAKLRAEDDLPPMPPWRVHDLRRTARSLLSRAKVDPDIAERVLGHAIPGVRRVYDQHPFIAEKRDALERLAAVVRSIVEPPPANVVNLRKSEVA